MGDYRLGGKQAIYFTPSEEFFSVLMTDAVGTYNLNDSILTTIGEKVSKWAWLVEEDRLSLTSLEDGRILKYVKMIYIE